MQDADAEAVVAAAQKMWARFYGKPRVSGSDHRERRRDRGVPRAVETDVENLSSATKPSWAGWLRRRHSSISAAAKGFDVPQLSLDESVWTESHDKELKFAQDHIVFTFFT